MHEVFDDIDNYITDDIHEYLTSFFNEDFTAQGWDNAINNMDFNRCDSEHLKNIKKLIQELYLNCKDKRELTQLIIAIFVQFTIYFYSF